MYQHVQQFMKMLKNLDAWLDKATAHAKARSFDHEVFVQARLAPDMYPLVKQVQAACDAAKFAAAYLSGKQAPAHPDNEQTMDELHARIRACVGWLETLRESDFADAPNKKVAPPWLRGGWLTAGDYLLQAALPNFYFHVTTAYDILRHNGVEVGKMDFLGQLPVQSG